MWQVVEVPHAKGRGNQHSTYSAEASRHVEPPKPPRPLRRRAGKALKELRHAPAPTRRGPHKTDETENLPDATTATPDTQATPRQRCHGGNKKEPRNPLRRAAVRGRAQRAPISAEAPSIDGGEPRHCGRPKEVKPAPGTTRRAEQKARRQTKEPLETPNLHKAQRQRAKPSSTSAQGPPPA
jgi:hypothetical protein